MIGSDTVPPEPRWRRIAHRLTFGRWFRPPWYFVAVVRDERGIRAYTKKL